ncbi:hypothetical protein PI124_g7264 [Phytophthora idaei]|nr:hypothetical protein PI125_g14272 [Phytophthora idaei]KAG3146362.1 hypothetical protein PI126_g13348 [Phytophthora idaei]KAG3248078.1 hypothetical protein PI124_g7264 [Phytophthora idaei]
MGKTYSEEVRARVFAAAAEGDNWRLVALHNGVELETARVWVRKARQTGVFAPIPDKRGGAYNRKLGTEHVEFLKESLSENCHLTLHEMRDLLRDNFGLRVTAETFRANLEGECYTLKKIHRDNDYRNAPTNKLKRQAFAIAMLQCVAADKKILYLDETNFNLWISWSYGWSLAGERAVDLNTTGKGRNIHIIACISRDGAEYLDGRFGSFTWEAARDFIRAMLRDQATREPLNNVAVVLDNAPCHNRVEEVFNEAEFSEVQRLRLGPYSPMLNGIENVFSVYKAAVKRYMAANRRNILSVPDGMTIQDHRSRFLMYAANEIFPEVVTSDLCRKCIHHTFGFISDAILMRDMSVGR